jgi:prepilin-type N-terminal cleavage/methylation domain-containing protein
MLIKIKRQKGFSLIELLVAMGLAFLVFLVIYMAYFISLTFFGKGTDALQEEMYVRALFARISDDLKYLTRLNNLATDRDQLEFEVFNRKVLETDSDTNDKRIQGSVLYYFARETKDYEGIKFKILQKREDEYEWWLKFGHSQAPNDSADPHGYPDDMRDPVYGKQLTLEGDYEEMIEQEEKKEFLVSTCTFTPYDKLGEMIEGGVDYEDLKDARSMRVELTYKIRSRYGEALQEKTQVKTVTTTVHFVNFMVEDTEKSGMAPAPKLFLCELFTRPCFWRSVY